MISRKFREPRRWPFWGAVLVLASMHSEIALGGPDEGQGVFEANDCGSCHLMAGPVDPVPPASRGAIKGPPLWFAGNKFKVEWLSSWLETPSRVRRVNYGSMEKITSDHPALSNPDAHEVSEYLMSLTDPALQAGKVAYAKLNRRKMFQGEKLFNKKQVCFGCHEYPSRQGDIGGFTGPSLVGAGQRLQLDWVYAFFKDPTRYYPNGRMPVYGDQAFEPYTEQELELLIQYIGNL